MAALTNQPTAQINLVTTGTTSTPTRDVASVITTAGTNLSIVKMKLQYQYRYIESQKKFLFFLSEVPTYLPRVGQKILIHHQDFATSAGALRAYFEDKSTNVAIGSFVRLALMTNSATLAARDGFTYALEVSYDDNTLGYIAGDCKGAIEYDVSPTAYDILKPIESNVIVTERTPYDNDEGTNILIGTTTGTGQTTANVAPMLFVERGTSLSVFSNLYKSFNLPITETELAEFTHTPYGTWNIITPTNPAPPNMPTFYHNHQKGWWAEGSGGTIVHPSTGYTGMFYGTAYQHLAYAGGTGNTLVDKILVMEIPQAQYGEIIDGKSLKIQVPKGSTTSDIYEIYGAYKWNAEEYAAGKMDNYMSEHDLSASYFGNPAALTTANTGDTYESNIVLLFCDKIKAPQMDAYTSWATGHTQVMTGEKVYSSTAAHKKAFFDFYLDQPVGIAYLDRGFAVITDPTIVDEVYTYCNFTGTTKVDVAANIIVNRDETGNIEWDDSQFLFKTASVHPSKTTFAEFLSYNVEKSMNVVCLASANEFFRTTNITAKELTNTLDEDFATFKNPVSGNLYPIIVTEIGLHDAAGNLLAIVKPTQPITKYWYDVVSFSIKIRL
jgi:hypothetical protein